MTIILILSLLIGIVFLLVKKYGLKPTPTQQLQFKKQPCIATAAEITFYNTLKSAVGEHATIFMKTNMMHIVGVNVHQNKKQRYIANNLILRSHLDFVICDPITLETKVIIEFDDGKPLTKHKRQREKLLIQACKTANIPLIGASVKLSYQVTRLKKMLSVYIPQLEVENDVRFCRQCHSPLVIKTAVQGNHKGMRFFTCSRQPHCSYTESIYCD